MAYRMVQEPDNRAMIEEKVTHLLQPFRRHHSTLGNPPTLCGLDSAYMDLLTTEGEGFAKNICDFCLLAGRKGVNDA